MKSLGLSRYALAMGAASALLAGCGGSQVGTDPPSQMGRRERMVQTQATERQSSSSGALLYATSGTWS